MIYQEDDGYGSYDDADPDIVNYDKKVNEDINDLKFILSKTIMTKELKFKNFKIEVGMIINRKGEREIQTQKFIYEGKLFYIKLVFIEDPKTISIGIGLYYFICY